MDGCGVYGLDFPRRQSTPRRRPAPGERASLVDAPLFFLLVHWLHPQDATWIDENLLNFGFQAATILLLYLVFSRLNCVGVAFASDMAAIPLFFPSARRSSMTRWPSSWSRRVPQVVNHRVSVISRSGFAAGSTTGSVAAVSTPPFRATLIPMRPVKTSRSP